MKTILLPLALLFAVAHALPYSADSEYAMVPTVEGGWKLIHVNEEPEVENFFTPETDIVFTLYTNDNLQGTVISWNDPAWITTSSFNPNNPIRLTIHGWNGGPTSRVNTAVREAYFAVGQFNVIEVDWTRGAATINYLGARNRVDPTGVVAANLLRMINEHTGMSFARMSSIGHSLGAHVSGFIGKTLNGQLGSIVGLDTAFPLFSTNRPDQRLTNEDALYVESIHTDAGGLGFDDPIGDASFYPNEGRRQPGCGLDVSSNCAHGRSHEFFAESIVNPEAFFGRPCESWAEINRGRCTGTGEGSFMGGEPLTRAEGVFVLTTNSNSPFGQGRS